VLISITWPLLFGSLGLLLTVLAILLALAWPRKTRPKDSDDSGSDDDSQDNSDARTTRPKPKKVKRNHDLWWWQAAVVIRGLTWLVMLLIVLFRVLHRPLFGMSVHIWWLWPGLGLLIILYAIAPPRLARRPQRLIVRS